MAAAKRGEVVPRPPKKGEYEVRFGTAEARRGWQDLVATIRNAMTDTWDFLTSTALMTTPTNYRLKGDLGTVTRAGTAYERWQHKPTPRGGARVWFSVDDHTVWLEQVHTNHPNETKEHLSPALQTAARRSTSSP